MANDLPPVLDTAGVADLLRMNIEEVRRLAREGLLPAHRVPGGRTYRFFTDEVLAWLRDQPAHHPEDEPTSQPQVDASRDT